jgi:hypothetical protein
MDTTTIATRVGAWPEWIIYAAALVGVVQVFIRRPRPPRQRGGRPDNDATA